MDEGGQAQGEEKGARRRRRKMRNFLLQPLVQIRLGLYSIVLACLFSGAMLAILYVNFVDFTEIVVTLTDTESEIRELFFSYLEQTKWWVIGVIMGFLLANIALSVLYTHKLVGPTIAFRHHVLRLLEGRFQDRVNLRKGDAFAEVAEELNRLAEVLQENNGKISPYDQKARRD